MQDLGGPHMFEDWKITGEREMFSPDSLEAREKLRKLENDRLRKLGLKTGDESISQMPYLMVSKQEPAHTADRRVGIRPPTRGPRLPSPK